MVLEIGVRGSYNCFFVGCCFQDLFNTICNILVQLPSSFFSIRFVNVHMVHPYSRIDTTAAWKKLCFILLDRFDFHMINNLSIAVYAFARRILMTLSVDETQLHRYVNLTTNFKELPFRMKMSLFCLKHIYSVLSAFTSKSVQPATSTSLCSKDSAWVGVFERYAMSFGKSASVKKNYRLLFTDFSAKPFSFIRSFNVRSTNCVQILHKALYISHKAIILRKFLNPSFSYDK